MNHEYRLITRSPGETQDFARHLLKQLIAGDILALVGDLAAGKTTFTQGLAAALAVDEYAASPTFTYINEYHGADLDLIHVDAYRLHRGDELEAMGFWEYLEKPAIAVIEWADIVQSILPPDAFHLRFRAHDEEATWRIIQVTSPRSLELEP